MDKSLDQERFIGGSFYVGLRKAGTYSNLYGLYTTSKRIVGLKPNALPYVLIPLSVIGVLGLFSELVILTHIPYLYIAALALVVVLIIRIQKRWGQKDPTSVMDLDARKNFEILRESISSIELKKAGAFSGYLKIDRVMGEPQKLSISSRLDYGSLRSLLMEFCSIPPQIQLLEV